MATPPDAKLPNAGVAQLTPTPKPASPTNIPVINPPSPPAAANPTPNPVPVTNPALPPAVTNPNPTPNPVSPPLNPHPTPAPPKVDPTPNPPDTLDPTLHTIPTETFDPPVNTFQFVFPTPTPSASRISTKTPTSTFSSATSFGLIAAGCVMSLFGILIPLFVWKRRSARRRRLLLAETKADVDFPTPLPPALQSIVEGEKLDEPTTQDQFTLSSERFSKSYSIASTLYYQAHKSFDIRQSSHRSMLFNAHHSRTSSNLDLGLDRSLRLSSDTCMLVDPLMMQNARRKTMAQNRNSPAQSFRRLSPMPTSPLSVPFSKECASSEGHLSASRMSMRTEHSPLDPCLLSAGEAFIISRPELKIA